MSNTSKYMLRTIRRHFTLLGLTYLILWSAFSFLDPQDPALANQEVSPPKAEQTTPINKSPVLLSLLAGAVFALFLLRGSPIPKSPVQQLMLNLFIFFYSFMAILPLTLTFGHLTQLEIENQKLAQGLSRGWQVGTIVYVFFALLFIRNRDAVAQLSPDGKRLTHWVIEIREHRR